MSKFFFLAGAILCVNADEEYIAKEFQSFAISEEEARGRNEWATRIVVDCTSDKIIQVETKEILRSETMFVLETENLYLLRYPQNHFVLNISLDKKNRHAILYTSCSEMDLLEIKYSLRDIFIYYLQQDGKLAVHSASIVYQGKAWLFSAQAGTGKSTHVDFWRQLDCPMEDLNGDLTVCFRDEEANMWASSTPWCGTSGIYCNKTVPLGGIVFLTRGWQNRVRELSVSESVLRLAARAISPAWVREQVEQNLEIAEQIGKKVLFVELMCLPEVEAAKMMREYIDKSNK